MGSGLIYAVIIGAWVVVGVQYLARRHDDVNESRSVDRFSHAMRILSRRPRPAAPDKRYVVVPQRESVAEVSVTGAGTRTVRREGAGAGKQAKPSPKQQRGRTPAVQRRPVPGPAARRRRMLLALLMVTAVVLVTAVLGLVPAWAVAVPGMLCVAFVGLLRSQVRRRAERARRRQATQRRLLARGDRTASTEHLAASRPVAPVSIATAAPASDELADDTAQPEESAGSDGWTPLPVHVPTYVTKPKAPRTARTIDLSRMGASASPPPTEEPVAADEPAAVGADVQAADTHVEEVYDDEGAIVERRVVND